MVLTSCLREKVLVSLILWISSTRSIWKKEGTNPKKLSSDIHKHAVLERVPFLFLSQLVMKFTEFMKVSPIEYILHMDRFFLQQSPVQYNSHISTSYIGTIKPRGFPTLYDAFLFFSSNTQSLEFLRLQSRLKNVKIDTGDWVGR